MNCSRTIHAQVLKKIVIPLKIVAVFEPSENSCRSSEESGHSSEEKKIVCSGWIRTTGEPGGEAASASCRACANRCCVHTTAEGDSDGSHSDAVPPGTAHSSGLQAVSVDLPAGQASGSPRHGWVPLEFGMSDHPAGPVQHACGLRDGKFYKSPKR